MFQPLPSAMPLCVKESKVTLQREKPRVGLFFLKCGLKFLLSVLLLGGPFGFIRVNIRMEGWPRDEGV